MPYFQNDQLLLGEIYFELDDRENAFRLWQKLCQLPKEPKLVKIERYFGADKILDDCGRFRIVNYVLEANGYATALECIKTISDHYYSEDIAKSQIEKGNYCFAFEIWEVIHELNDQDPKVDIHIFESIFNTDKALEFLKQIDENKKHRFNTFLAKQGRCDLVIQ